MEAEVSLPRETYKSLSSADVEDSSVQVRNVVAPHSYRMTAVTSFEPSGINNLATQHNSPEELKSLLCSQRQDESTLRLCKLFKI